MLIIHLKVKHVPEWFPGAGFKRFAKAGQRPCDATADGPLEYVKESLKVGSWGPHESASILELIVVISPTETMFLLLRRVLVVWQNFGIGGSTKATSER